jgi:hypothetical protein
MGSHVLYIGSHILYMGSHILYIGSPVLYMGSYVLYMGSRVLYMESHVLYMGSHVLYMGSHVFSQSIQDSIKSEHSRFHQICCLRSRVVMPHPYGNSQVIREHFFGLRKGVAY